MVFLWAPPRYKKSTRVVWTVLIFGWFLFHAKLFLLQGTDLGVSSLFILDVLLFVLLGELHLPWKSLRKERNLVVIPGSFPKNHWLFSTPSRWGYFKQRFYSRIWNHYCLFTPSDIRSVESITDEQLAGLEELDSIDTTYTVTGKPCVLIRFHQPLPYAEGKTIVGDDLQEPIHGICISVRDIQETIRLLRKS